VGVAQPDVGGASLVTRWLEKPLAVPVPVRFTFCGESAALSEMFPFVLLLADLDGPRLFESVTPFYEIMI
jgi:hypothetical protein